MRSALVLREDVGESQAQGYSLAARLAVGGLDESLSGLVGGASLLADDDDVALLVGNNTNSL
jgi:hypothetical protein